MQKLAPFEILLSRKKNLQACRKQNRPKRKKKHSLITGKFKNLDLRFLPWSLTIFIWVFIKKSVPWLFSFFWLYGQNSMFQMKDMKCVHFRIIKKATNISLAWIPTRLIWAIIQKKILDSFLLLSVWSNMWHVSIA